MMSGYSRPVWDGEAGLVAAVRDGQVRALRLMRWDGASGEVAEESVELSSAMRGSLAVARAGDGELHLAAEVEDYAGFSTLSYLRRRAAEVWEEEGVRIDGTGSVSSLDLAIASEGDAHLAMVRWPQRVLEYGSYEERWEVRSLAGDLVDEVGEFASMALTPVELPVIVYGDTTNGAVRVVRSSGEGGWLYRDVAEGLRGDAFHPQIAVDGGGRVHVLFWEGDSDAGYALRYAREKAPASSLWDVFPVAEDLGLIAQPRAGLAIDDGGRAHVLYSDRGRFRQVYGRWQSRAVEE